MLLYGASIAPFTYFTSFFFKSYPSAQVVTILLNIVLGSIAPILMLVMYLFDSTRAAGKVLAWILRLSPSFCFGFGFLQIGSRDLFSNLDGRSDLYPVFSLNLAGADILMMAATIPL